VLRILESTLFLSKFVCNINCGIMDNNNQNPNTGAKGVFPGSMPSQGVAQQPVQNIQAPPTYTEQPVQNTQPTTAVTEQQNQSKTYIRLETKNSEGQLSGILEIDLISFRERGQESRYLSINAIGAGQDGGQSDTTISIDNETDFNRFKKFISELNWND
jgi:hypothetical protein